MAKSLRSKWKRKMKAIKRVRYGAKETARLEEMLKAAKENEDNQEATSMPGVQFVSVDTFKKESNEDEVESMEMDVTKRNPKTLRDEHGQYPVWMNQRKIKKLNGALKKNQIKKRKQRDAKKSRKA